MRLQTERPRKAVAKQPSLTSLHHFDLCTFCIWSVLKPSRGVFRRERRKSKDGDRLISSVCVRCCVRLERSRECVLVASKVIRRCCEMTTSTGSPQVFLKDDDGAEKRCWQRDRFDGLNSNFKACQNVNYRVHDKVHNRSVEIIPRQCPMYWGYFRRRQVCRASHSMPPGWEETSFVSGSIFVFVGLVFWTVSIWIFLPCILLSWSWLIALFTSLIWMSRRFIA